MIQKPFNDADLIYNYEEHRYVPTTDLILRKTGIDLVNGNILNSVDDANPSELGDRVLDEISAHIYATIYGMTLNGVQGQAEKGVRQRSALCVESRRLLVYFGRNGKSELHHKG